MSKERDVGDRILHLLFTSAANKLQFTLDGVSIAPLWNHLVALNIALDQAGSKGIGVWFGKVPPLAAASYNPTDDVYDVPDWNYGTTAYQRQAIIHEAIHAYLDMAKSSKTALTDEALAYVGGVLFHIHDTTAAGSTPTAPWWAGDANPVFKEAFRIASGLFTSGSKVVSADDAKAMRDAVAADTTYADLKADPTIKYGNNGVW